VTAEVRALSLDPDELAACVSCGLCLPHCPTYRVSGEEALSPRGRIAAMRAAVDGAPFDDAFLHIVQTCVQCRGCETACPSGVHFGRLMERTREAVAPIAVPRWQRIAYGCLGHHRLLLAFTSAGGVVQRMRLMPPAVAARLNLPPLPVRQHVLQPTGEDVWLFTGCVMDAWQRPAHKATLAVLAAMGVGVALPGPGAACCGALHVHAGLDRQARRLARKVMGAFPGDAPILVNSAGCGAALKDYGHLLGDARAKHFATRVFDVHEWIASHADRLPPPAPRTGFASEPVAVQDPCHLRHVQHCESAVREVLRVYADLVEIADEGRCCGAGGAYSLLQPKLAGAIRDQKIEAVRATGARVVASANPGCALWLSAGGLDVRHPMELVADAADLYGERS
jgi:glycolate oxidase iron-sulfur subunit